MTTAALPLPSRAFVDPRPLAENLRQWRSFHLEFAFLPRRFKIAFFRSLEDRVATAACEVCLYALHGAGGRTGFRVPFGGGVGCPPMVGTAIRKLRPWPEHLNHCEAILRDRTRLR